MGDWSVLQLNIWQVVIKMIYKLQMCCTLTPVGCAPLHVLGSWILPGSLGAYLSVIMARFRWQQQHLDWDLMSFRILQEKSLENPTILLQDVLRSVFFATLFSPGKKVVNRDLLLLRSILPGALDCSMLHSHLGAPPYVHPGTQQLGDSKLFNSCRNSKQMPVLHANIDLHELLLQVLRL